MAAIPRNFCSSTFRETKKSNSMESPLLPPTKRGTEQCIKYETLHGLQCCIERVETGHETIDRVLCVLGVLLNLVFSDFFSFDKGLLLLSTKQLHPASA
jgi:hypothetical protein